MDQKDANQNEELSFIKGLNSSNFFSTQSQTAQSFYPSPDQSCSYPNIIRHRPLAKGVQLQRQDLSRSFQKLQQIMKQSPMQKIKKCKEKLNQTKLIFSNECQLTHRKQNTYEKMTHCTNILKNRFVQLYETKKYQLGCERIMIKGKMEKQDYLRRSFDDVRMKKIQRQEGLAQMRKSLCLRREDLHRRSAVQKQETKHRLNETMGRENQWRLSKTGQELEALNRFTIRKGQMEKVKRMRSCFNYRMKVKQQQELINEYEAILRNIEQSNPELAGSSKIISLLSDRSGKKEDVSTVEFPIGIFLTQGQRVG